MDRDEDGDCEGQILAVAGGAARAFNLNVIDLILLLDDRVNLGRGFDELRLDVLDAVTLAGEIAASAAEILDVTQAEARGYLYDALGPLVNAS